MKKLIRKIIPKSLIQQYRNIKYSKNKSDFQGKSTKETFTQIYNTNHWQGENSISGSGSDEIQTQTIVRVINNLITELNITTILDIPCGDFNWMRQVNLSNVKYVGADIVDELIKANSEKYGTENINFESRNLITDQLPKSDLVIIRDCLVHLSYGNIYESLKNLKESGSKYLLSTTFTDHSHNYDICTGDWRTVNLQNKPFNFPIPVKVFNENCTEGDGAYKDKSLVLYLIEEIVLPPAGYKES